MNTETSASNNATTTVNTGRTVPTRTGSVERDSTRTAEPVARTRDTTQLGTDLSEGKPAGGLDAMGAKPKSAPGNLHALNQTHHDLLQKELPNGYAFIQSDLRTHPASTNRRGTVGKNTDTSSSIGQEQATGTGDTRLRPTSGLASGEKPAGQLDALTATPKEIKAEKAKPYKDRNLLVEALACCPEALRVGVFGWPSGVVCSPGLIYCMAPSTAFGS